MNTTNECEHGHSIIVRAAGKMEWAEERDAENSLLTEILIKTKCYNGFVVT